MNDNNKKSENSKNDFKKEFKYYVENQDLEILYRYQTHSKNFVFYKCNKRPKCSGRAKVDRSTDEVIIIENYDKHVNHENFSYEQFIKL